MKQKTVATYDWHSQRMDIRKLEKDISPTLAAAMGMGGANMNCPILIVQTIDRKDKKNE